MKKQKQWILILCILILALGGLSTYLFLTKKEEKSPAASNTQTLLQKDPSEVASVTVKNESGSFTVFQDSSRHVSVEGYEDLPLNEELLQSLLTYASHIRGQIEVKGAEKKLDTYGLSSPLAQVETTFADGSQYTLDIGISVPGQTSADTMYIYYKGQVYTSYKLHLEPFLSSQTDYLQQQITPVSLTSQDANVTPETLLTPTSITLTRRDWSAPAEIRHQQDTDIQGYTLKQYSITADGEHPYEFTSDATGTDFLNSFFNLSASQVYAVHPSQAQLEECGLHQPFASVTLDWENASGGKGSFSLLTSSPEQGQVYIQNTQMDIIYALDFVPVFLTVQTEELISTYLLTPDIYTVQALELTTKETQYRFSISSSGSALKSVHLNQQEIAPEQYQAFYQNLIAARADSVYTGDEEPSALPLEGTLTFTFTDNSQKQILLYGLSEREFLVSVDNTRLFTMNRTKWDNLQNAIPNP